MIPPTFRRSPVARAVRQMLEELPPAPAPAAPQLTDAELEAEAAARMAEANDGGDAQHGFLSALARIGRGCR